MKIKIIKTKYHNIWYKDRIGEIFKLKDISIVSGAMPIEPNKEQYLIKLNNSIYGIWKEDCVDIRILRENKLKRILR